MSTTTLSWQDRFALMQHYNPTDEQVCTAFGLTPAELDTARHLLASGMFKASTKLDVTQYAGVFTGDTSMLAPSTSPKVGRSTTFTRPESATRAPRIPQKRGRKGDKIQQALMAVPTVQVPVETFMLEHGVSLAVLRQSKRFLQKLDPAVVKQIGRINVRQDKGSRQLMIWRETT